MHWTFVQAVSSDDNQQYVRTFILFTNQNIHASTMHVPRKIDLCLHGGNYFRFLSLYEACREPWYLWLFKFPAFTIILLSSSSSSYTSEIAANISYVWLAECAIRAIERSSDGGDFGFKKFKRGYGGIWRSLSLVWSLESGCRFSVVRLAECGFSPSEDLMKTYRTYRVCLSVCLHGSTQGLLD